MAEGLSLERGFAVPPAEARLHSYWWWLNGNVTKEAITRDLEAMKEKGFGGALITDAGGANQDGNRQVPRGVLFASEAWRELYCHALREGARLKLEMALNIQSGWNLGGPRVAAEDAAKILCWTETAVEGPESQTVMLAAPPSRHGLLRDVAVLAIPSTARKVEIKNWEKKALLRPVHGGNGPIAEELAPTPKGMDAKGIEPRQVVDLTGQMAADGSLTWTPPAGNWKILRFCYTVGPRAQVSTCSQGWEGLALDPMDATAFQRYWDDVVEPLVSDARAISGCTLRYLHTDSWEIEPYNWTARLPEEFRKRRGYEITPWLPVMARQVVGSVESSERFLHDFRKTVAELSAEGYYGPFLKNARRHGLQVRAESGGPHGVPIDAQHCLGMIDVPMSEFWATSWRHRVTDAKRFFVKQPASAAHTYGKRLVAAEGFTTIGPHWQERVWDNLKPNFDRALCEGLNQLVWTLNVCSPKEMGLPGQEFFAGTHFNPNSTWWQHSEGFLAYINRCQWLLQQGLFVADVLYYYGDLAPNFAGLKAMNPAGLPPGYDYDVASEHVLLHRASVKDGRIVLPDGMSYGALVLPSHPSISPAVLRKLRELAEAGATLIGPRPESGSGLLAWQKSDTEEQALIAQLWGTDSKKELVQYGSAAEWLKASSLPPDFEVVESSESNTPLDYIHRQDGEAEIYFVANPQAAALRVECLFRVKGGQAELWNPVTGEMRVLAQGEVKDERTRVTLKLEPYGSAFVIFREQGSTFAKATADRSGGRIQGPGVNFTELKTAQELTGPWEVSFDPAWFYPDKGTGG
ncbi:MAG: glycosyl hydrolase, partial [Kiritimatiellae bacterium]|nr:glycosyl hydrolase [Kiritimatiellia bacterium]